MKKIFKKLIGIALMTFVVIILLILLYIITYLALSKAAPNTAHLMIDSTETWIYKLTDMELDIDQDGNTSGLWYSTIGHVYTCEKCGENIQFRDKSNSLSEQDIQAKIRELHPCAVTEDDVEPTSEGLPDGYEWTVNA